MLNSASINLGNLLLSFSDALDLANPSIFDHQLRTAFITWQMARGAQLSPHSHEKLFIGALLHDVGALSSEEKKRLHDFEEGNTAPHCRLGAELFALSPLLKPSSRIVRLHHEPWNKRKTKIDSADAFESQALYLADFLERSINRDQYILHQHEELTKKIISMSGAEIHADVVDLFVTISDREEFWFDLVSPHLYSILLHFGPLRKVEIKLDDIFSIADFLLRIIDFKSRFTATHSSGVAECAAILATIIGWSATEANLMRLAGYLHDVGKLAVPNAILEKPGKLTQKEFAVIKQHAYFTFTTLKTVEGLGQLPEWAAFHHEKPDGSGYPFRINAEKLSLGSRIMTIADIFTALAEDRPYRNGMSRNDIKKTMSGMFNNQTMDKRIINLLFENYEEISAPAKEKQAIVYQDYENLGVESAMTGTAAGD